MKYIYLLIQLFILYLLFSFIFWDILWVKEKSNIFFRILFLLITSFLIWLNISTEEDIKKNYEEPKNDYWC